MIAGASERYSVPAVAIAPPIAQIGASLSRRKLLLLQATLVLIGVAIAIYITYSLTATF